MGVGVRVRVRGCELDSIRSVTLKEGSRGWKLFAGGDLERCSYPRLDCVGEEERRAEVGGEVRFTIK